MFDKSFRNNIYILLVCLIVGAYFSFIFFKVPNWDWYSYHYYNGWAFLNNRLNIDFMASLSRTYYNPVWDSLIYLSLKILNNHPLLFLFIMGLKNGLFIFVSYKIYELVFISENPVKKLFNILFCLALAILSPILLISLNFDSVDLNQGFLILTSVYLILKFLFKEDSKHRNLVIAAASLITGAAVGLKYTSAIFGLAFLIITLIMYKNIQKPVKTIFYMILGMFLGFLITDGYWIYLMWEKLQNPVFPYFNNIFHSPYSNSVMTWDVESQHLRPKGLFEIIFYPLIYPTETKMIGYEDFNFDAKFPLTFFTALLTYMIMFNKTIRRKTEKIININVYYFVLNLVVITYYLNVLTFLNYRYILPLFVLAPIVILVCIYQITNKITLNYILSTVVIAVLITMKPIENTGLYQWPSPNKVQVIEDMNLPDGATVLCGTYTSCYFAPDQNPKVKYFGFVLPEHMLKFGIWNDNVIKNRYFLNKYLETELKNVFKNTKKDLYITYSVEMLGKGQGDKKLYEKALKLYSENEIKNLGNCRKINHEIYGYKDVQTDFYLCKLK